MPFQNYLAVDNKLLESLVKSKVANSTLKTFEFHSFQCPDLREDLFDDNFTLLKIKLSFRKHRVVKIFDWIVKRNLLYKEQQRFKSVKRAERDQDQEPPRKKQKLSTDVNQ